MAAHRRQVHEAILDTTAALVEEYGLRSVTMSQIAEDTGIGRATLYKYFPDIEAILRAWHERQINAHLNYLAEVGDKADSPSKRLEAILEAYALISKEICSHDVELFTALHGDKDVAKAEHRLQALIRAVIAEAAEASEVRNDITPDELASYCLHALGAAASLEAKAAVRRLITVILAGLRSPT